MEGTSTNTSTSQPQLIPLRLRGGASLRAERAAAAEARIPPALVPAAANWRPSVWPTAVADSEGNRINRGSYSRAEYRGTIATLPPQFGPTIATLPRRFGVGEYPPEHKPGKGGSSSPAPSALYKASLEPFSRVDGHRLQPGEPRNRPTMHQEQNDHPYYLYRAAHPGQALTDAMRRQFDSNYGRGMWAYDEATGRVQVGFITT